jgi:hypothetical protein
MLNVIMLLNVINLNAIMLNAAIVNVTILNVAVRNIMPPSLSHSVLCMGFAELFSNVNRTLMEMLIFSFNQCFCF